MANMPLSAPPVLQKVSGIPASQAGINKDGSANTAGVKNLGYGYSSTGDINTAPWHANTYQDSVNNIGKYSTDLNANREAL
ncbi:MAG: hypothetical protein JWM44_2499, partial [Bacilli bacterium]|nr:hypothetical protein [Bacilli bacterium]